MKAVILEDEKLAAERLAGMLADAQQGIDVIATLDSVRSATDWFSTHPEPDLLFADVHLADGHCFEFFEQYSLSCPVIFTTAFDQYAIKAFQVMSLAYLLKPVTRADLDQALSKFQALRDQMQPADEPQLDLADIKSMLGLPSGKTYKSRFMVNAGEHLMSLPASEILYFDTAHRNVYLIHESGRRYTVNYSIQQLCELLDPKEFFRISRQQIVRLGGIKTVTPFSNHRLLISMANAEELTVSRDRVGKFKEWLGE